MRTSHNAGLSFGCTVRIPFDSRAFHHCTAKKIFQPKTRAMVFAWKQKHIKRSSFESTRNRPRVFFQKLALKTRAAKTFQFPVSAPKQIPDYFARRRTREMVMLPTQAQCSVKCVGCACAVRLPISTQTSISKNLPVSKAPPQDCNVQDLLQITMSRSPPGSRCPKPTRGWDTQVHQY